MKGIADSQAGLHSNDNSKGHGHGGSKKSSADGQVGQGHSGVTHGSQAAASNASAAGREVFELADAALEALVTQHTRCPPAWSSSPAIKATQVYIWFASLILLSLMLAMYIATVLAFVGVLCWLRYQTIALPWAKSWVQSGHLLKYDRMGVDFGFGSNVYMLHT